MVGVEDTSAITFTYVSIFSTTEMHTRDAWMMDLVFVERSMTVLDKSFNDVCSVMIEIIPMYFCHFEVGRM